MSPYFGDADAEIADLDRHLTAQQATASRTGLTYDQASNSFAVPTEQEGARLFALVNDLSEYQKRYWWMKPALQLAMARTGVAPDSATAKMAAEVGARVEADQGFGFQERGTSIKAALMAMNVANQGQGAAYGGSYEWGNVLRDTSSGLEYVTHYGDQPDQSIVTRRDPTTGVEFGSEPAPVDPNAEAARTQAQAVLARYQGRTDLSPAEHAEVYGAEQTAHATDEQIKEFSSGVNPLTPVVRTAFMTLDAPLQELQGQVRNVYGALHGKNVDWLESQSDLGIAADTVLFGDDQGAHSIDVGGGFFTDPESEVAKERQKRIMERGNIGGHGVTLGRWGADLVFEPGSTEYSVLSGLTDLGVALAADPANLALAKVGKLREANKMFTEAGGVLGLRRTVSRVAVMKWVDGEDGVKVVQNLADTPSFLDVYDKLNRKVAPEVAVAIADAHTPADVLKVLLQPDVLGASIRYKPDPRKIGSLGLSRAEGFAGRMLGSDADTTLKAVRTKQNIRLAGIMPKGSVDLADSTDAVTQVERVLRNAKMPEDAVYEFTDKMARAPDQYQRLGVLMDAMSDTKGMLVTKYNVNPEKAKQMTRLFVDTHDDLRRHLVDEVADGVHVWNKKTNVDGTLLDNTDAHLLIEHLNGPVPLPDARRIRRATSKASAVWANSDYQLRWGPALAHAFQDDVWKPLALIRGAWTMRVIGEEQVRMAAAGLESMFHHPLSAISMAVGRKGEKSLVGDSLSDVAAERGALVAGRGGFGPAPTRIIADGYVTARKTEEEMSAYLHGWAGEIAQLHADPVAQAVAQFDSMDAAKAWFRNGDGQKFREQLAKLDEGHPELLRPGTGRTWTPGQPITDMDQYIDSVAYRISLKTGDNPALLDVVKTGKFGDTAAETAGKRARGTRFSPTEATDESVIAPGTEFAGGTEGTSVFVPGTTKLSDSYVQHLRAHLDSGPAAVKTPRTRAVKGDALKVRYDRAVDSMFGALMSRPSNWLSRNVAFKQFYWKDVQEMLPLMDEAAQAAAIQQAKAAKIELKAAASSGDLTLEGADEIAKGHALDNTKGLLYDMSERSQFFDATRLIFPFGEAWKEVLTRWSKLAIERPQTVRRFQQIVEGARGPFFGELLGQPAGQGFFHKNDRGEEVFTYPFSEGLTSSMIGVPVPMEGRVAGLNMIGQIYPGLGPMAQIPAAWFLPDGSEYDGLREILFPYGEPGDPRDPMELVKTFAPSYLKRILAPEWASDPDSIRLKANSVMDIVRYLASTGDYDIHTREGQQKLAADAKAKAGQLSLIRGIAQNFAPSSPSPDFLVHDKDGRLVSAMQLAAEYRALQKKEHDGTIPSASQAFLDQYGTDPFLIMQSKTQSVSFGYPTDSVGLKWMRDNPEFEKQAPNVFGYFAPKSDDPNDFDYNAYLRALESGAKEPLTPEQFIQLGVARMASIEYKKAKDKVGANPSAQQRALLGQLREALIKEYPGYGESLNGGLGLKERANTEQQITELQRAMGNPKLADTDAGQALAIYLKARDTAEAKAKTMGLSSFHSANRARPLRDALRAIGEALAREHPGFEPMWDQVLQRKEELKDDLDEEAAA